MSLFKSSKCQLCKEHRYQRFCMRRGKDICWECCNNLRYDRQCPQECKYSLSADTKGLGAGKTNADSIAEYKGLIEKLMDLWIKLPEEKLQGRIPQEMAQTKEGKKELTDYLHLNGAAGVYNISYLRNKLKLKDLIIPDAIITYEDISDKYLKCLLAGDYKGSLNYHIQGDILAENEEYFADYELHKSKDPVIRKMKDFFLISSALSEDKKQALVYFDINEKYDLTLKLVLDDNKWVVDSQINGKPEIVNGENEALQQIAVLLSKNQTGQGEELLTKYLNLYPDSADLYYYRGVIDAMRNNSRKAVKSFMRSVRLDNQFTESIYNYALQLHLLKEFAKAKEYYKKVLLLDDQNIQSMNNLAAILIDEDNIAEAEKYLTMIEKIDTEYAPMIKNRERIAERKQ